MGGKRYDEEPKLNMKKVFSVFLGIIVIIMFCLTLSKLLQDGTEISNKTNEEPNKYFAVYTNNKWGVINQKGNYIITPKFIYLIVCKTVSCLNLIKILQYILYHIIRLISTN